MRLVDWRTQLASGRSRLPERAVDLFAENPFWSVRKLAERLGVAFTSAQRAIARLESVGIVEVTGEARRFGWRRAAP